MNKRATMIDSTSPCACGSGKHPTNCCLAHMEAAAGPSSAQALMRSRYTAYTIGRTDYLLRTWHPSTRPAQLDIDPALRWLGLKIKSNSGGQPGDRHGTVEFIARFKLGSRADRIHEDSRFVFENDLWLYVDGEVKHQPRMRPGFLAKR